MPENRTIMPLADKDRPWSGKKKDGEKPNLRERFRRIGIGSVAAAADVRGNQCETGRKKGDW